MNDTDLMLIGMGYFTGWVAQKLYYEGVIIPNMREGIK